MENLFLLALMVVLLFIVEMFMGFAGLVRSSDQVAVLWLMGVVGVFTLVVPPVSWARVFASVTESLTQSLGTQFLALSTTTRQLSSLSVTSMTAMTTTSIICSAAGIKKAGGETRKLACVLRPVLV